MSQNSFSSYKPVRTDANNEDKLPEDKDQSGEGEDEDEDPHLTSCGLGWWRPKWLQCFANPLFFMINFAIIGVIQGMTGTYFVASMSTLEKRFAFDSKISGLILIADNLSQMMVSPIIGYLGSRVHRPRMIATGELILSLSCLTTALPYLIYGPGTHLLHDDDLVTKHMMKNETRYELCPANTHHDCSDNKYSTIWPAVFLLWLGSFFRGLGFTAYFVIGMPYIDDSVSKNNSPLYISLITALRLGGPAGGFLLSALSLRFYENPFYDPGITRRDPRFIGAWWIGFTVIGVFLFFASLPMFLFPRQFKGATIKQKDLKDNMQGKKATISALKRLIKNPILMFHLVGSTIRYIGLGGFYIFKTKYIESQYRQSSSSASLITGSTSILPMAIGIILGGVGITFIKPSPQILVIYMFLVELCSNTSIFSGMFLGCPAMEMPKFTDSDNQFSLTSSCNTNCGCTTSVYTPICSADGKTTFFSPCYAGCQNLDRTTNTLSSCACIPNYGGSATTGYCPNDADTCGSDKLFTYLLVLTLGGIISSTARTGNYLLLLRSVDPKDKSFAMGMMSSFMAIFAYIPYPLIFGAITDSACLIWERTCGKRGNCWVYDQDKFRYYLHGSAIAFMFVGSFFDLGIIFMAKKWIKNFYDEPNKEVDDKEETEETDGVKMSDIVANGVNGVVSDPSVKVIEKLSTDQTIENNNRV